MIHYHFFYLREINLTAASGYPYGDFVCKGIDLKMIPVFKIIDDHLSVFGIDQPVFPDAGIPVFIELQDRVEAA